MVHQFSPRCAFLLAAIAALPGLAIGCGAPSSSDSTGSSTAEALRVLGADEIVGTIAYGQTSAPIVDSGTPRYRALRFSGSAGDAVDIWIRSKDGDPRAWLLGADFSNLSANDNADGTTKDSHITFTLPTTATYYVAFREVSEENATFTVSLAKQVADVDGGRDAACNPEEQNCRDAGAPGRIVHGANRSYRAPSSKFDPTPHLETLLETFGMGIWDGYVSFTATSHAGDSFKSSLKVQDATGTVYVQTDRDTVSYQRLPMPVSVTVGADTIDANIGAEITQLTYEVTKNHSPLPARSFRGKFIGIRDLAVARLNYGLPSGVSVNAVAAVKFFDNFTNGHACSGLKSISVPNLGVGTNAISFTGALEFRTAATCVSSRLATPQDPNADFEIDLSNITIGDPN